MPIPVEKQIEVRMRVTKMLDAYDRLGEYRPDIGDDMVDEFIKLLGRLTDNIHQSIARHKAAPSD